MPDPMAVLQENPDPPTTVNTPRRASRKPEARNKSGNWNAILEKPYGNPGGQAKTKGRIKNRPTPSVPLNLPDTLPKAVTGGTPVLKTAPE